MSIAGTNAITELWAKCKAYFQATLVSGTNIKTVNNESLLGSGNISVGGGGSDVTGVKGNSESTYRTGNVNLTAANIGAAASSHTHAAGDVTSGIFALARIPTGTTASTVALGNHTHSGYATTSALANYLPLSGGTLTGTLTMDHKYLYLDASDVDTTTPPSSGVAGNSRIQLRDKNNTVVAQLIPYIGSTGRYGTQFGTTGNWLYITTDGSDPYVSMTNAAAWRTGLGLGNAATKNTGTTASTVALGNHSHAQYFDDATTRTKNYVLAAPSTANGAATFRALVAADIPRLPADHINLNGYSWVTGATPTPIGLSTTAYTSVSTSGWTYYKFLASGGSMYVYHAFGVVKFKNQAITTAHGSGYINSANLYIRLPVKARVIKSATFGTTMGGGLLGVTFLAAGGTGDWKSTTDSLINLPVRLFSPVSQAAANSNNDNQFIPVDIWFTATG